MLKISIGDLQVRKDCYGLTKSLSGGSIGSSNPAPPPPDPTVSVNISGYLIDADHLVDLMKAEELILLTPQEYESLLGKKITE